MVVRYLEQKNREKQFFSHERQLEKPASGAAAAKGKGKRNSGDCVQWTTKRSVLEEASVERNTIQKRSVNPKELARGSRPSISPRRKSLERGKTTGKSTPGKKTSQRASPSKRVIVQNEILVITGVLNCKHRGKCAFHHTGKAGGEPKTRHKLVVVVKTLDHTQAGEITSLKFMGDGNLLHGVSAIPVKSILRKLGKDIVERFRLARVAERSVKEREKKDHTLGITCQGGEVVQILWKQTWNLLARLHGTCTRTYTKDKGACVRHVNILPNSQQDNSRNSCRISVSLRA